MKSISPALQAHFGLDCMTLAVIWKLTTVASVVIGFTTHDQDIVYGGITYLADTGMTQTASNKKSDLSVDNLEVTAFLDSDAILDSDLRAGVYDWATVEIRIVNWADLTQGEMKVIRGTLGQVVMRNGLFTAEIRGLTQQLTTVIGALYGPICRAELYSGLNGIDMNNRYLCRVDVTLYRQSGTVDSSVDAVTVVPTSGLVMPGSSTPTVAAPSGWFNDGIITFTSGAMNGLSVEIKSWDGLTVNTFLPMPFQPLAGDTFTIEPGCDHTKNDCYSKFNNIINLRAEPDIPGMDLILLYPNPGS
jgi:uncharacterized phage protein (TIGR02218 family)